MKIICPRCKKPTQALRTARCGFCYEVNKFKADYCQKCRYDHSPCYLSTEEGQPEREPYDRIMKAIAKAEGRMRNENNPTS